MKKPTYKSFIGVPFALCTLIQTTGCSKSNPDPIINIPNPVDLSENPNFKPELDQKAKDLLSTNSNQIEALRGYKIQTAELASKVDQDLIQKLKKYDSISSTPAEYKALFLNRLESSKKTSKSIRIKS